jgi:(S)-2-hydroxyglutarate dehydrogenase
VGLATAKALIALRPGASVVVVDKEERVASHQSGHNSGVIHSGLYYRPGSLKARLAVEGAAQMYRFCEENGVSHHQSGKLVIATSESELGALAELERRGSANGLSGLRRIPGPGIAEIEPSATGLSALHVPGSGVADFAGVALALAAGLERSGAEIRTGTRVSAIAHTADGVDVGTEGDTLKARWLINCAGLHSDRMAALAGVRTGIRIIPFRGEYYTLDPGRSHLVKALIYPVPDPRFPFLGVHFTRRWDGSVEVGPNALLALAREQYRGVGADLADVRDMVGFSGFWKLSGRHLFSGARELYNSRSRRQYARLARRLVPEVLHSDLTAGGAGVRAQAVDRHGRLVDDFVIETAGSSVHVLNAPSPGATASLAIGEHIASEVLKSV